MRTARISIAVVVAMGLLRTPFVSGEPASADNAPIAAGTAGDSAEANFTTESLRGRVVWLAEVLARRFQIETDVDAAETICALEATDGTIYPLVKDSRGRGFWLDERLRGVDVELLVRRYHGSPVVQVITVYTLKEDGRYEFDYWCDICSIPMFELKLCECCQGAIRIRERRVGPRDEKTKPPTGDNRDASGVE